MDTQRILTHLREERDRLDAAITALERVSGSSSRKRGRKPGRHMSAEARAKIAAAQRARWAKQKREAKKA